MYMQDVISRWLELHYLYFRLLPLEVMHRQYCLDTDTHIDFKDWFTYYNEYVACNPNIWR